LKECLARLIPVNKPAPPGVFIGDPIYLKIILASVLLSV
jgi:hypothetical protein